jgi:hypothetical protein
MAFKLSVLIVLTVFIKHDVLCFQPAFTERKNLVLQHRGSDQWRNKRSQLQMYETTQIQSMYTFTRRVVRGSKYAVSTILFKKSMKSKLIALAHALFVCIFISFIASLFQNIPRFAKEIPFGSMKMIFEQSYLKREQWVNDMNLFIKLRLNNLATFKWKFLSEAWSFMNVMNTAGDQTNRLRVGAIADVVRVSDTVMEKSHVMKSRKYEYIEEEGKVALDSSEEDINNIDGISNTSIADVSDGDDTCVGPDSELEEILKHSKFLIGSDDCDNIDESDRNSDPQKHILSTPLPLNHGNGGSNIDQYHTLSTPLFLTTSNPVLPQIQTLQLTPVSSIQTLQMTPVSSTQTPQLTPVSSTLESQNVIASLQSPDPPSALSPTFYPFSNGDSFFGVSSPPPSSPDISESLISDKVDSNHSKSNDKTIDVGLIGMPLDHSDGFVYPDYTPLMPPQEGIISQKYIYSIGYQN